MLDEDRAVLSADGRPLALRPQALDVLVYLLRQRGRVVAPAELLAEVWTGRHVTENSVARCISDIRGALRAAGGDDTWIETRHGRGFAFVGDVAQSLPEDSAAGVASFGPGAIAVLPFESLGMGRDDAVFGRGLSDDLIRCLAAWRLLPLIAAGSTWTYRRRSASLRHVAEDLACRYVVTGRADVSGSIVRVRAHLCDGPRDRELACISLDAPRAELFAMQEELAHGLAASLRLELIRAELQGALRLAPRSMSAWHLTLRGMSHFLRATERGNRLALAMFERAARADPRSIPAAFWLGYLHHLSVYFQWSADPSDSLARVASAARRCLRLDPMDASGHLLDGLVQMVRGESQQAVGAMRRAVDANPSDPYARSFLGQLLALAGQGSEALGHANWALRLSPCDPRLGNLLTSLMLAQFACEDYEGAAATAERAAEREPSVISYPLCIATCAGLTGDDVRARRAASRVRELRPAFSSQTLGLMIAASHPDLRERFWTGLGRAGL